jgi:hypothetical protein
LQNSTGLEEGNLWRRERPGTKQQDLRRSSVWFVCEAKSLRLSVTRPSNWSTSDLWPLLNLIIGITLRSSSPNFHVR